MSSRSKGELAKPRKADRSGARLETLSGVGCFSYGFLFQLKGRKMFSEMIRGQVLQARFTSPKACAIMAKRFHATINSMFRLMFRGDSENVESSGNHRRSGRHAE